MQKTVDRWASGSMLSFVVAFVVACAAVGLPTPDTMNERIAAAQGTVTQVRVSATQLLTAKQITVVDAENVLKSTDAAAEGIAVVRTIAASDPATANAKLTATVSVLTALQAYLATKRK